MHHKHWLRSCNPTSDFDTQFSFHRPPTSLNPPPKTSKQTKEQAICIISKLPPLGLLAQGHWSTVAAGRRADACSKGGTASCGRGGAVGTALPASSLTPHSFPHSRCFGNFAGSCAEGLCAEGIVCTGYGLLRICCLAREHRQDL